ncbi:MAG TPA: hypothetical protein VF988_05445 [Verrucomicrobiae bacterium]
MNDSELDQKLKAAREPVLRAGYQQAFAETVLKNLRSDFPKATPMPRRWLPRLAWTVVTATCIVIAFVVGQWQGQKRRVAGNDILANANFVRGTLAMFPNQVRAIVKDERGLNLVLSEQNVPASPPIYVRICDGKRCSSLVTFSGQQIQIAGQNVTVLAEADGGIILEGNKFVWSSAGHYSAGTRLKIEAMNLGTAAL